MTKFQVLSEDQSVMSINLLWVAMLNELRDIRPFLFAEGRRHEQFSEIQASSSTNINITDLHRWIETKTLLFSVEHGN